MAALALGLAIGGSSIAATTATGCAIATVVPIAGVVGMTMTRGICNDMQHGTTRNTAEAAVGAVCAVGFGLGGAIEGAARGTMIYPGAGTIAGAGVGATFGALSGDYAGRRMASAIFDEFGYELRVYECQRCGRRFTCRIYTDQSRRYCTACDGDYACPAPLRS